MANKSFIKNNQTIVIIFIAYILMMTGLMIWLGIATYPDRYFFILLLPVVFIRKARKFLFDWLPFLLVLLSYEFLRSIADHLNNRVNYQLAIWGDSSIFTTLPNVFLQQQFFHPNSLQWYDYGATFLYFLHFMIPITFGFLVWLKNRLQFREFVTGFLILSYSGLLTYVVFPAAPPWLASQNGMIPHINKILNLTLQSFPEKLDLPTIYDQLDPNPVAALPSLHAAYPFLVFLFALRFFGKKAYFFLPYVILVWLSIVYLGEHYVFDVLAGIVYAIIGYLAATRINYDRPISAVKESLTKLWLIFKKDRPATS